MTRYKNLAGDSGVAAYATTDESITVHFQDGSAYRYTNASAGRWNVDRMKALADHGRGLNTFITAHVKDKYAAKVR
jgi:hypothetical protein